MCVFESLSHVQLFVTPWTVAHQASLSMEFFRQESWSGLPCPSPGHLSDPGIKPGPPALLADSLLSEPWGEPSIYTPMCAHVHMGLRWASRFGQKLLLVSIVSWQISWSQLKVYCVCLLWGTCSLNMQPAGSSQFLSCCPTWSEAFGNTLYFCHGWVRWQWETSKLILS